MKETKTKAKKIETNKQTNKQTRNNQRNKKRNKERKVLLSISK